MRPFGSSRGLPRIPDPHVHHYHQEWDESERDILAALPWIRKLLRESDVQYRPDMLNGPTGEWSRVPDGPMQSFRLGHAALGASSPD